MVTKELTELTELKERVTVLEEKVAQITQAPSTVTETETPWWEQIIGVFKDDPHFDEAMRSGREWRQSEQMEYDEDADAPS